MASSNLTIYSALGANLLIAITKFIAGALSNSSSMISEGIHSLVDTANELLLLFGIKRSNKPPDEQHPFGYGKELYFWSFIVSILIFGLGGGLSIYQGILHMLDPEPLGDPTVSYIVLGCSVIFESISLYIALKEFNKARGDIGWWEAVVKSKDPSSFLVLFEDAAAVAGLLIVAVCLFLGHQLNTPWLDGLASLLVGLLLVVVSIILARESRSLLMGEGVSPETKLRIKRLVEDRPNVVAVKRILSTYQSPKEVVLMINVSLKNDLTMQGVNEEINKIRENVQQQFNLIKFVFIEPTVATTG